MEFRYVFLAFLLMPLWYISLLIPRKKNIIIFGSWFGKRYSDNPMYLYEYATKNTDFRCIWLTHKNSIIDYLNIEGKTAYKIWSFKGIWYSLNAGIIVVGSGKSDVNPFFINGAKIINLWHGAPMKKIAKSNSKVFSTYKDFIKKIFFPNIYEYNIDYVLSTSNEFNKILSEAFGLNTSQIILKGYPRNDIFFLNKKTKKSNNFKLAYLPTFRDNSPNYDYFLQFGFDCKKFLNFLESNNLEFYVGSHFVSKNSFNFEKDNSRINLLPNDEFFNINEFLTGIDILITDYSGVYFDFLLTKKPILLAPFDLDFYENNCRELYFDYLKLECFGFAFNWNEIMIEIEKILNTKSKNSNNKQIAYNDYSHGNSTKEIANFLKEVSHD